MNLSYKLLRELKKPSIRKGLGLALIEGSRLVTDALASGVEFVSLYFSKSFVSSDVFEGIFESFRITGVKPVVLNDSLFNAVCDTKTPQGVLAVIKTVEYKLEDIMSPRQLTDISALAQPIAHSNTSTNASASKPNNSVRSPRQYVILDKISDPGNAGSIIRTAEAAGFTGLIMSEGCVDLYSPKTLRASMGSALRLPVVQNANLPDSITMLKESGVKIYATSPTAVKCYFDFDLSTDMALVVGNEAFGVAPDVMAQCDEKIMIPMRGDAESLNAGVAAGILIYESVRQSLCRLRL